MLDARSKGDRARVERFFFPAHVPEVSAAFLHSPGRDVPPAHSGHASAVAELDCADHDDYVEDVKRREDIDKVQAELGRAGQGRVTGRGARWGKVGTQSSAHSGGVPASSLRRQEVSVRA
jgi:hypothetical protein